MGAARALATIAAVAGTGAVVRASSDDGGIPMVYTMQPLNRACYRDGYEDILDVMDCFTTAATEVGLGDVTDFVVENLFSYYGCAYWPEYNRVVFSLVGVYTHERPDQRSICLAPLTTSTLTNTTKTTTITSTATNTTSTSSTTSTATVTTSTSSTTTTLTGSATLRGYVLFDANVSEAVADAAARTAIVSLLGFPKDNTATSEASEMPQSSTVANGWWIHFALVASYPETLVLLHLLESVTAAALEDQLVAALGNGTLVPGSALLGSAYVQLGVFMHTTTFTTTTTTTTPEQGPGAALEDESEKAASTLLIVVMLALLIAGGIVIAGSYTAYKQILARQNQTKIVPAPEPPPEPPTITFMSPPALPGMVGSDTVLKLGGGGSQPFSVVPGVGDGQAYSTSPAYAASPYAIAPAAGPDSPRQGLPASPGAAGQGFALPGQSSGGSPEMVRLQFLY